jgi:hypothetical protein
LAPSIILTWYRAVVSPLLSPSSSTAPPAARRWRATSACLAHTYKHASSHWPTNLCAARGRAPSDRAPPGSRRSAPASLLPESTSGYLNHRGLSRVGPLQIHSHSWPTPLLPPSGGRRAAVRRLRWFLDPDPAVGCRPCSVALPFPQSGFRLTTPFVRCSLPTPTTTPQSLYFVSILVQSPQKIGRTLGSSTMASLRPPAVVPPPSVTFDGTNYREWSTMLQSAVVATSHWPLSLPSNPGLYCRAYYRGGWCFTF